MGRAITATVVAATLAFAGCGEDEPTAEKRPRLPADLAAALASESDRVAESLEAGDGCAAHRQAQALRAHVGDAVGSGEVPPELGRQMSAAASALGEGITCEPAPPPAPEPVEAPAPTCEQLTDELAQIQEQLGQDEGGPPGDYGQDATNFLKELEKQGRDLEHQLRKECGFSPEDFGDGGEGGPPGHDEGGDGPGNSDHGDGD